MLAQRLKALLGAGELPNVKALREEFAPRQPELPVVRIEMPTIHSYDALLGAAVAA